MELMKKALAALHAAEARFHELLNPVEHLAERTRDLAKATAQTVEVSIEGLSTRLSEAVSRIGTLETKVINLMNEKPSASVPDSAPAAAVPQDAKPSAEVSTDVKPESPPSGS